MFQYSIPLIPLSPVVNVDTMIQKLGSVMVLVRRSIREESLIQATFRGVGSVQ
jgi:hypothetical protein